MNKEKVPLGLAAVRPQVKLQGDGIAIHTSLVAASAAQFNEVPALPAPSVDDDDDGNHGDDDDDDDIVKHDDDNDEGVLFLRRERERDRLSFRVLPSVSS